MRLWPFSAAVCCDGAEAVINEVRFHHTAHSFSRRPLETSEWFVAKMVAATAQLAKATDGDLGMGRREEGGAQRPSSQVGRWDLGLVRRGDGGAQSASSQVGHLKPSGDSARR